MCNNSVLGSQLPTCLVVDVNSKAQVSTASYNLGGTTVYLHFSEVLSEFVELFALIGTHGTSSQWDHSFEG